MPRDKTLDVRPGALESTSMRYHELWLQRWLYSRFYVREGYPVPVVFASPMDAFGHFAQLWADENNPFKYLLELKDENGTPLYEPHPSPIRYPLISVMRKGLVYRSYQNFSQHRWRHVNWPTISDAGSEVPGKEQIGIDLTKCDLGNINVSRMPMAWDFRYQIDHYCLRPDTQAFYLERLMRQFWRSGGVLQSWMDIEYPGWGSQYIRIYIDGEIDQSAPDDAEFQDKNVEYRTSYTITVEGFDIDLEYQTHPTLWKMIAHSADPDSLNHLLRPIEVDLRTKGYNYVLESRPDIPAAGTCQDEGNRNQYLANGTVYILLGDIPYGTNPGDNVYDPNRDTPGYVTDPIFWQPRFSYGIPSTLQFGIPIFSSGTQTPIWISGSVDPVAENVGIELPSVGTFYTNASGSYTGLLPFNYSGTAVPHYALASAFSPPVRVYENLTEDTPHQDYTWFPLHLPPWVSGTVTPAASGITVEFPAVGSFAVNASTGSYTGTVPYGYSGTAVPHYFGAEAFTPPVRVYENLSADTPDQNYAWTPIIHHRGTDSLSTTVSDGNVSEYQLFNYTNPTVFTSQAFGTYFESTVPFAAGTDVPFWNGEAFGTYTEVTVFFNAGTEYGTHTTVAFGTYTETVTVFDAGTESVGLSSETFGTYTQRVFSADGGTNAIGIHTAIPFGTYAPE